MQRNTAKKYMKLLLGINYNNFCPIGKCENTFLLEHRYHTLSLKNKYSFPLKLHESPESLW